MKRNSNQNVGYDSIVFTNFLSESSFSSDTIRFIPRFALTSNYKVNNGSQHFSKINVFTCLQQINGFRKWPFKLTQ